jgi:hypothetical protein
MVADIYLYMKTIGLSRTWHPRRWREQEDSQNISVVTAAACCGLAFLEHPESVS